MRRALPWLLASLVAACSPVAAIDPEDPPPRRVTNCATTDDCGEGLECVQQLCVASQENRLAVALQVTPPSDSGLLTEPSSSTVGRLMVNRVSGRTTA